MDIKEVDIFLRNGVEIEATIVDKGAKIRDASKKAYGSDLLDARIIFLSVISYLMKCKSGVPGETNSSISERLLLITTFIQGTFSTEALISEGQYVKASSALKQDFEIMTRLKEIRGGNAKFGKVPNVKNAPKGSQRFYGELNDISHISKANVLESVILKNIADDIRGVSPIPSFASHIARKLYELHIFLCFEAARESVILFEEMYGKDTKEIEYIIPFFINGVELIKRAGFETK